MKSPCCTIQNYPNPNIHTVILSVERDLHETAFTFVMKLQQVPVTLEETACAFALKLL